MESAGQCLSGYASGPLEATLTQNNLLKKRAAGKGRRCLHHLGSVLVLRYVTLNRPTLCCPSDLWLQDFSEYFHLFKNTFTDVHTRTN